MWSRSCGVPATAPQLFRFDFDFFRELAPPVLQQVSPNPVDYPTQTMTYSGSGNVTAGATAVDLVLPPTPDPSSTSGCETSDFANFPSGNVALIQRGTCTFRAKADNAAAAGAAAVVICNEGQPGRSDLFGGTLGSAGVTIPVVSASFATGNELADLLGSGPVTVHVATSTESEVRPTANILADSKKGDPGNVVVVGAHLDSVLPGPGINDNGSGSATILAIAEQLTKFKTTNKVRFAWWGAEELGLVGSTRYVASLSNADKDAIALNLNFDMVGSPNFVRFVYDGDNSAFPPGPGGAQPGPPGSGAIERVFSDYFSSQGLASAPTPFNGRSDYGPFITTTSPAYPNGIPAGGLFTGAEGIKTAQEAAIYGGTPGVAYDHCYHQACDTYDNVNLTGLDQMSDAEAHAIITLANSPRPAATATAGAKRATAQPRNYQEQGRLAA
jgi:Zn-dependent M28 family amino/carboxypeptidase